jgi:hypothetical protein
MNLEKRNPDAGNVRAAEIKAFGKASDCGNHNPNLIDLQAFRLCQRFRLSLPLARAAAELAFANGRAA